MNYLSIYNYILRMTFQKCQCYPRRVFASQSLASAITKLSRVSDMSHSGMNDHRRDSEKAFTIYSGRIVKKLQLYNYHICISHEQHNHPHPIKAPLCAHAHAVHLQHYVYMDKQPLFSCFPGDEIEKNQTVRMMDQCISWRQVKTLSLTASDWMLSDHNSSNASLEQHDANIAFSCQYTRGLPLMQLITPDE